MWLYGFAIPLTPWCSFPFYWSSCCEPPVSATSAACAILYMHGRFVHDKLVCFICVRMWSYVTVYHVISRATCLVQTFQPCGWWRRGFDPRSHSHCFHPQGCPSSCRTSGDLSQPFATLTMLTFPTNSWWFEVLEEWPLGPNASFPIGCRMLLTLQP